jgi:hypothetical protein
MVIYMQDAHREGGEGNPKVFLEPLSHTGLSPRSFSPVGSCAVRAPATSKAVADPSPCFQGPQSRGPPEQGPISRPPCLLRFFEGRRVHNLSGESAGRPASEWSDVDVVGQVRQEALRQGKVRGCGTTQPTLSTAALDGQCLAIMSLTQPPSPPQVWSPNPPHRYCPRIPHAFTLSAHLHNQRLLKGIDVTVTRICKHTPPPPGAVAG